MNTMRKNRLTVVFIADLPAATGEKTAPLRPGDCCLVPGDALSIPRAGQILRVVSGCAWISFGGEDTVLQAGQEMVLKPGGDAAVVSALEDAPLVYRVYIDAPPQL